MIHPNTKLEFISPAKGFGVVATEFIPAGTITWIQDELDQVINSLRLLQLGKAYQNTVETYAFRNNNGEYVLCWDNGKYVNHSFNSNCLTTAYNFEIAVRDIQAGEELTDDYGYLNISEPFCAEKEMSERTVVYPDDLVRFYKKWDLQLEKMFYHIPKVAQPLNYLLNVEQKSIIQQVLQGDKKLDSILNCYYEPNKQTTSFPQARS